VCDWGGTNLFSVPVVCNDDASISDFDFETLTLSKERNTKIVRDVHSF